MSTNKFQSLVERLMTSAEVRERAAEMNLDEKTTEFLVNEFDEAHDWLQSDDCSYEENDIARGNGRLGCMQSWEDTYERLCDAMGFPEGESTQDFIDAHPEVEKVWNAFFAE